MALPLRLCRDGLREGLHHKPHADIRSRGSLVSVGCCLRRIYNLIFYFRMLCLSWNATRRGTPPRLQVPTAPRIQPKDILAFDFYNSRASSSSELSHHRPQCIELDRNLALLSISLYLALLLLLLHLISCCFFSSSYLAISLALVLTTSMALPSFHSRFFRTRNDCIGHVLSLPIDTFLQK